MSFTKTSKNIAIDSSGNLTADCSSGGVYYSSSLDLNSCVGNDDGVIKWGSSNFSHSARNIALGSSSYDKDSYLCCDLKNESGNWGGVRLDLDDHIANINGVLTYQSSWF